MPSRKNYKTEAAYQMELTKVRECRRAEAEKKIGIIEVKAKAPLPEIDIVSKTQSVLSDAYSKAADKIAERIRKNILREWGKTHRGNCIIVIDHNWKNGRMYYETELTAYGAVLEKDWLKDQLRAEGLEICGYQTQRDLMVK